MSDAVVRRIPCASTSTSAASRIARLGVARCLGHVTTIQNVSYCRHGCVDARTPRTPSVVPADRPRSDWDAWGTESARLPAGAKALVAALLPGKAHPVPRRRRPDAHAVAPERGRPERARERSSGRPHATARRRRPHAASRRQEHPDLLARRLGELQTAPDAVVSPSTHSETLAVLAVCDERGIAVVPFGGGTSVVGGVDPDAASDARA